MTKDFPAGKTPVNKDAAAGTKVVNAVTGVAKKGFKAVKNKLKNAPRSKYTERQVHGVFNVYKDLYKGTKKHVTKGAKWVYHNPGKTAALGGLAFAGTPLSAIGAADAYRRVKKYMKSKKQVEQK